MSVAESPAQMDALLILICGLGFTETVIVFDAEEIQLLAPVVLHVYEPAILAIKIIAFAPLIRVPFLYH